MTDADRPALAQALAILGETFNEPVGRLRSEGFYVALRDLEFPVVAQAVREWLSVGKRFPVPADLRDLIAGRPEEEADLSWGRVLRAVHQVGGYRTPNFDDVTNAAIADVWGSWGRLCESLPADGPELVGWMKQYKSAYIVQAKRGAAAERFKALPPAFADAIKQLVAAKKMP